MQALLIEFNKHTGKRAGNINPRDEGLFCFGHQNLDVTPALEIRIIKDGRILTQYENTPGVTILNDDAAIDAAIDDYIEKENYGIENEILFKTHLEQRNIILDDVEGDSMIEVLKNLKIAGIKGIKKHTKLKTKDFSI